MKKFNTIEEFETALKERESLLILKHSLTCPVSGAAYEEFEQFVASNPTVEAGFLAVQDGRELSNHIAEKYNIKHESPQAIWFNNSAPVWHASHWSITFDSLTKALQKD